MSENEAAPRAAAPKPAVPKAAKQARPFRIADVRAFVKSARLELTTVPKLMELLEKESAGKRQPLASLLQALAAKPDKLGDGGLGLDERGQNFFAEAAMGPSGGRYSLLNAQQCAFLERTRATAPYRLGR